MKKILLTLIIAVMFSVMNVMAQKFVIGSKVPEIKGVEWLNKTPVNGRITLIEFYQSTNATSKQYFPKLKEIKDSNPSINIVVLTREKNEAIDKMTEDFGDVYCIAYDTNGKAFESLGVKFVPFTMLADSKGNLLWQGNLSQFTQDLIKPTAK